MKNVLECAIITSTDSVLLLTTQLAAPADIEPQAIGQHSVQASLEAVEKQHIMNVLEATGLAHQRTQGRCHHFRNKPLHPALSHE